MISIESTRVLRPHLRHYLIERPRHQSAKDKFYRGQCSETRRRPPTAKTGTKPPPIPSKERQEARCYDLRNVRKPVHTYQVVPEKSKQSSEGGSDDSESSDTASTSLAEPVTQTDINIQETPSKVPKGRFVTETFGIKNKASTDRTKKKMRKRNYNCPGSACNLAFENMSALNQHYKAKHEPVMCQNCRHTFNTPSTLQ